MITILVVGVCLLLIYGCRWLIRLIDSAAKTAEIKREEERFYNEAFLSSIQSIDRSTRPVLPVEITPLESLLKANEVLMEKKKVKNAIEKELGISM
jgi:hypothetical protein